MYLIPIIFVVLFIRYASHVLQLWWVFSNYGCIDRYHIYILSNIGFQSLVFYSTMFIVYSTMFIVYSTMFMLFIVHRGYYTVAWTYEVYLWVENIFYEWAQQMGEIFFPWEDKLHMIKPTCNFLLLHKYECFAM